MPWLRRDDGSTDLGRSSKFELLEHEFHLVVEGKLTGIFMGMGGGEMEIATITHDIVYETGLSTTLCIPGATSFTPISLTRGFANYIELYNWFMQASNGHIISARRDGTIKLIKHGQTVVMWHFYNAWLSKLSSFSWNAYVGAKSARVGVTLVVETIEYEEP